MTGTTRSHRHALRPALAVLSIVAAAAIAATGAPTADGYSSTRTDAGFNAHWDLTNAAGRTNISGGKVHYEIAVAGCADHDAFTGPGDEFQAIQRAFQHWEDIACCSLAFDFRGFVTATAPAVDSHNVVLFTDDDDLLDTSAIAVTFTSFLVADGEIIDADLVFNDPHFAFDVSAPADDPSVAGVPLRFDIESIATHESGHFAGLDHSFCQLASMVAAVPPGFINLKTIEPDDVAGMSRVYPGTGFPASFGAVSGAVTKSGSPVFGAVVAAFDIHTAVPVAHAISEKDGTYVLQGVPPGNYYLIVFPMVKSKLGSFYATVDEAVTPGFWTSGGVVATTAGTADVIEFTPGAALTGVNFLVTAPSSPNEPNDTRATATTLGLGQVITGVLETNGDQDFYHLGDPGSTKKVLIYSLGWLMSVDVDPHLRLFDSLGGSFIAQNDDRDGSSTFDLSGANFDAALGSIATPLTLTSGKDYYVRVASSGGFSQGPYALLVLDTAAFTTSDKYVSNVGASPKSIPADGTSFTQVNVNALTTLGQAVTSSPTVMVTTNNGLLVNGVDPPGSTVAAVETSPGSGVFAVALVSTSSPAVANVTATIGGVALENGTQVFFTGAVDAATSTITALPLSIPADGASATLVRVTPRDALGSPINDGTMECALATNNGTLLAAPVHQADGSFTQSLQSAAAIGTATVTATINPSGSATALAANVVVTFAEATAITPPSSKKKNKCGCWWSPDAPGGDLGGAAVTLLALGALIALRVARGRRD